MTDTIAATYHYECADMGHMHSHFMPPILGRLSELKPARVLDLGCGNGSLCRALKDAGYEVCGFDPSLQGVEIASKTHPDISFRNLGVYDEPPVEWHAGFDVVLSTEVAEHLYNPTMDMQKTCCFHC